MKNRILVVDDEKEIADLVEIYLVSEKFDVIKCYDGDTAIDAIEHEKIDLAILDIMLPGISGLELCRRIRKKENYPVIMLTAKDSEVDKVTGLTIGADDYVVKPFSIKVLLKRIEVVLKRKSNENIFMCGQVMLYSDRKQVFVGETEISLTLKEYQLLEYFIMNQNQVLTKEMIMENIWGIDSEFIDPNTISVMISRLKKKLNDSSNVISNVFGMGYRMGD